jgi:hypothetical protein
MPRRFGNLKEATSLIRNANTGFETLMARSSWLMRMPKIADFFLRSWGGYCSLRGRLIGFRKLSNDSGQQSARCNCHISSCFSLWSSSRCRYTCFFAGDGGARLLRSDASSYCENVPPHSNFNLLTVSKLLHRRSRVLKTFFYAIKPGVHRLHQEQQALFSWIGGQGIEPYEQNTQQSPGFGLSLSPHPLQS